MERVMIHVAVRSWELTLGRLDRAFESLSDEALMEEVSPGRNRLIYLLGHLTAVNDGMMPLLGFGALLYPELRETFIARSDREVEVLPSTGELRGCWKAVNDRLATEFTALPAEDWMARHQSVTDEEFALDPLRNRLSVMLSRTNHMSFHLGQIIFALPPGVTRAVVPTR